MVLSGHDHHRVDRMVDGSRLLKPGMDAHYACVIDFVWDSADSAATPVITAETIKVADYEPDQGGDSVCFTILHHPPGHY